MDAVKSLKKKYPVFYTLIAVSGMILFWRGLWGLIDQYLFPQHYELSLWISVFWGLLILAVLDLLSDGHLV
jgi:Na+-transporting NADH:ubiquinone oxidoreductase subunit NqrD